ncbi:glyoxalase bleomycin resistance protein dioxygenase [Talaromyces proteolyticus]|uniref:Glyoxalase bleomycin resistance protein dioxygenase n=1 Tax=Talaromyces proteolyticus TaxID=1131652 RepID=A0AAD4Q4L5_9EURO|nr:glyoxalase bleomycin resistance protein dioxygenase [Talaromyces proteolyticus]KAH8703386.1 glyoxalase bleomycin resistance protein dioxygenase [Talaromyces proteolyticus]
MAFEKETVQSNVESVPILSPVKLAHVVFRSTRLQEMVQFYQKLLGAHVAFQNNMAAFLAYDDEHHRIGILAVPEGLFANQPSIVPTIDHVAFTYNNLDDLAISYEQRKAAGLKPVWCVNHGSTTSMYYDDPDGNKVEMQVDNFETMEEAFAFTNSEAFHINPIGTDFDPDEFVQRVRSGEDHRLIKKRVEIGPRKFPGVS